MTNYTMITRICLVPYKFFSSFFEKNLVKVLTPAHHSLLVLVLATLGLSLCLSMPALGENKVEEKPAEETAPKYEVSIELGRATYKHYCTPCHGIKGDGKGFNAPRLLVQPANHTDAKFMSERNDTKLFDTINLGGVEVAKSTLMPPWGAALGDERVKSLILHLRELCNCQATKNW